MRTVFLSTLSLRRATESIQRCIDMMRFLSTLSLRRATVSLQRWAAHLCDFYPRSPCGERLKLPPPPPLLLPISIHALLAESDAAAGEHRGRTQISIHALLAESDVRQGMATLSQPIFLSTLSLRRATCGAVWGRCAPQISIHALLAESDQLRFLHNLFAVLFLSTLSLRRATTLRREPRS